MPPRPAPPRAASPTASNTNIPTPSPACALTCFRYRSVDRRKAVRTTNAIERRFREVRRRTRPTGVAYSVESGNSDPLFFPLLDRLANGTESQRHRRPSWVVKDLTHAQQPSNRQRDPLWPSPESTGQAIDGDLPGQNLNGFPRKQVKGRQYPFPADTEQLTLPPRARCLQSISRPHSGNYEARTRS
jgi:hypothetical protein